MKKLNLNDVIVIKEVGEPHYTFTIAKVVREKGQRVELDNGLVLYSEYCDFSSETMFTQFSTPSNGHTSQMYDVERLSSYVGKEVLGYWESVGNMPFSIPMIEDLKRGLRSRFDTFSDSELSAVEWTLICSCIKYYTMDIKGAVVIQKHFIEGHDTILPVANKLKALGLITISVLETPILEEQEYFYDYCIELTEKGVEKFIEQRFMYHKLKINKNKKL